MRLNETEKIMGLIDLKKKEKKEKIINSAYDLFIEKGLNSTSISDITRKAKVAKGTFYLYFKNKFELKDYIVIAKTYEIFLKAISDLEKSSIEGTHEKIIFIIDEIINYFNYFPESLQFIEKNLSWSMLRKVIEEDDELNIKQYISNLLGNSEYEFDNPELMIYTILEIVNSTCHNVIIYNEPVSLDVLKKYLYKDINSIIDNHIIGRKDM